MDDTVMFVILIATGVIAGLAAVWLFSNFVYRPSIKRRAEKRHILKVVSNQVNCWKQNGFTECDTPMLSCDDFFIACKHMGLFNNENDEVKAFLLLNSLKYGMPGKWGQWLLMNRKNQEIVLPLVNTLDGQSGTKVMWRASYILSKIFGDKSEQVAGFIPDNIDHTRFQLKLIKKDEISNQLTLLSQNDEPDFRMKSHSGQVSNESKRDLRFMSTTDKKKAIMVLREFNYFKNQIEQFTKEQTISHRIKLPSFTPASIVASIF